jgi:hypothetical protein
MYSAAPEKDAGFELRTVATFARSNDSARSHPLKKFTVEKNPIFFQLLEFLSLNFQLGRPI